MAEKPDPEEITPTPAAPTEEAPQEEPKRPRKATKAIVEARIAQVVDLLVAGNARAVIVQHAAKEWQLQSRQVDTYIQRAHAQIRASSAFDHDHELGLAVKRSHYLFQAAMKVRDFRLGATVERDRARLLGLDQPQEIRVAAEHTGEISIADTSRIAGMTLPQLLEEQKRLEDMLDGGQEQHAHHDADPGRPH